jgi:hypothetical protein
MIPFDYYCPEEAMREMLILHVTEAGLPLPVGEYGFVEFYCEEEGCDCRRTLFRVVSPQHPGRALATINYGWESVEFYTRWMHGDAEAGREIKDAALDPLNPNSELADALLESFRDFVKANPEFSERLKRHYKLFKKALRKSGQKGSKR